MAQQYSYDKHFDAAIHGLGMGEHDSRPMSFPILPQRVQVRFTAGSLTTDVSWSITDDVSRQVYEVTSTGSATEADMLDNAVAALRANASVNALFAITEDGADDVVFTARHPGRSYTIAATGGPSATQPVTSVLQTAGGSGLPFGFVRQTVSDGRATVDLLDASTELADLAGYVIRTEANAFREIPDNAQDTINRGKHLPVAYDGRIWLAYSGTAPSVAAGVGGDLYLRRAQTSASGTIGDILAAPAGSAQVYTLTPTTSEDSFMVRFSFGGASYTLVADGADGSYSATEICDDLRASATAQGIAATTGLSFGGTATLTITTPAGTALDSAPVSMGQGAFASITETDAADVDAINIGSIAFVERVNAGLGLALIRVIMRR